MEIAAPCTLAHDANMLRVRATEPLPAELAGAATAGGAADVRAAFTTFVGQTFFGQLLGAMRSSLGKPAYFHGGQAEEIFQKQLDQVLAEKMTVQSAEKFAQPMFERQFPRLADELAHRGPGPAPGTSLSDLGALRQH